MGQYCVKCGKELRKDAVFCPHCGQRNTSSVHETGEWTEFGTFLGYLSLGLAKGFLYLLMGGIVFACVVSGIGILVTGAVLLYHFATSGFCILPPVLASVIGIGKLSGPPLAFGGIAAVFIALLLITAAAAVIKAMCSLRKWEKTPTPLL